MNILGFPSDYNPINENLVSVSPGNTEFSGVVQADEFKADRYSAKTGPAYIDMTPSDTINLVASNVLANGAPIGGGGSGDVVGPVSSVDNAVTRFDGVTGKLIQNSGVIIDDTNNITGVNSIDSTDYKVSGNDGYLLRREAVNTLFSPSNSGNITITDSIGIGNNSLNANIAGTANISIGNNSQSLSISGNANVSIGNGSLENSNGNSNTILGHQAGMMLTTGDSNVLIGRSNHVNSLTLNSCVSIGQNNSSDGLTNCIQIGSAIATAGDNQAIIGNASVTSLINAGNAVCDLGTISRQFKDLYLSGNINAGQLSLSSNNAFSGVVKNDLLNASVLNTNLLMSNLIYGLDNLSNPQLSSSITCEASENWINGVGYGSNFVFRTTDNATTASTEKIRISDEVQLSCELNMNTNKIINCVDPTLSQDVATKNYIDSTVSGYQPLWQINYGCNLGTQADRFPQFSGTASDGNDATPSIRSYYYNIQNPVYIVAWNLLRENVSSNTNFYVEIETGEGTNVFTQTLLTSILVAENTQLKRSSSLSPLTIGAGCRMRVLVNAGSANPQNVQVILTLSSINQAL